MSEKKLRFRKGTIDFDGKGEQWCVIDSQKKRKTNKGEVDECLIDHQY